MHTRAQPRAQAALIPTPRAPLDGTPEVPQLRTKFRRSSTIQEGKKKAKKIKGILSSSWRFSRHLKLHFRRSWDPKEVRKAEAELDGLRMNEGGDVSLNIVDFRSLVSITGYWGEKALINYLRKGLPSLIMDQLASYPPNMDYLQYLVDVTLELDTRCHERQKEKNNSQEKKTEASNTNSSHTQNSSIPSHKN
ncbi:hypothetical protein O181_038654 [Austropuccinia psidii MF-1]|uniref:Uncharacterized protein n=1 Tax=Austropuccinia psidii MF-1 TaxID=1389203 RepID=A0A9Q3HDS2_9BASI|nr:hypothetical protein [Austropuccinia psidii MF-1]